ncbi:MAG TPA: nuclear transport factor 2 family protein [Solirubrobacteraceae bacterium]|nr:nuclear transport factor 2 family protein [Solirubrobacteraceae bacterium]
MVSNAKTFRSYLERFASGDIDGAAELLADEFAFDGPILRAHNKGEFLAGSATAAAIARGCTIHHQWVDGDDVCSIYDFEIETAAGTASIPMAEWSVIRDGKLVSSRLLFDTAAMAPLMSAQ